MFWWLEELGFKEVEVGLWVDFVWGVFVGD